jgi:NADH:ubiquinone oxidoreductase subunit D
MPSTKISPWSSLHFSTLRELPDMAKEKHVIDLIVSLASIDTNPIEIGQ